MTPWLLDPLKCCASRQLTFKAPISAKFGPKSAKMQSTHRCRFKTSDCLIFEAQSISKGIPYGDSFTTVNKMQVTRDPTKETGCILQITTQCKFWRNLWGMKGKVILCFGL